MRKRVPRIRERNLGRERAWGQCYDTGRIEICPKRNRRARTRLDTVIHETLHYVFPECSEREVKEAARVIREVLWADHWRRVQK